MLPTAAGGFTVALESSGTSLALERVGSRLITAAEADCTSRALRKASYTYILSNVYRRNELRFSPGGGGGGAAAASCNVRLMLVEPASELLGNMVAFICVMHTCWGHQEPSGGQQRRLDVLETPD